MAREKIFPETQRGNREAYKKSVDGLSHNQIEAVPFGANFSVENEAQQGNREDDQELVIRKVGKYFADNADINPSYKNLKVTFEPRSDGPAKIAGEETSTLLGAGYILKVSKLDNSGWTGLVEGQKSPTIPPRILLSQFKKEKLEGATKELFAGIDIDTHIKPLSDGESLWISNGFIEHLPYASDKGLDGALQRHSLTRLQGL